MAQNIIRVPILKIENWYLDILEVHPIQMRAIILYLANPWMDFKILFATSILSHLTDFLLLPFPFTLCQEIKWVQKKGTNFLWAPAYSPEPPQSNGVLHLVLRDSFLSQPIRFKETFQEPMRIKESVVILAITGSKNKHTIKSGRDWTTCWCL